MKVNQHKFEAFAAACLQNEYDIKEHASDDNMMSNAQMERDL